MDSEIPGNAFAPAELELKLNAIRPAVIAFNGKKAARVTLGVNAGTQLDYGRQRHSLGGAVVWVMPSTSGAANGAWDPEHGRHWQ
jgi:TDG/mug DNA glycosylase family protein